MTYVVHQDHRVRDFVSEMLKDSEGDRTFTDYLSSKDIKRLKDGDQVYGTLQVSQMFSCEANIEYYNIVPPKQERKIWKVWHYTIRRYASSLPSTDVPEAQAAIFLIDNDEFEVEDAE